MGKQLTKIEGKKAGDGVKKLGKDTKDLFKKK